MGEDKVKFNIYKSMKFPDDDNACCMRVNSLIPSPIELVYDFGKRDPLEDCLTKSLTTVELSCEEVSSSPNLTKTVLDLEVDDETVVVEEENKAPNTFLAEDGTKPVIISSALDEDMETKLLGVLKKNMEAFAWSIDDIKGIIPSFFMHKRLMEDEFVPSIDHQRWLNPAMKDKSLNCSMLGSYMPSLIVLRLVQCK